jgi:hypothetical protein
MKFSKLSIASILLVGCVEQANDIPVLPTVEKLMYSFQEPTSNFDVSLNIDTCQIQSFPKATEFIEGYKIIRLNTPPGILVGSANKVLASDQTIFVVDNRFTQQVYAFDPNGNFKTLVGRKGDAPGQYEDIVDVAITESSIYILDMGMRIFNYDVKDFSFKNSIEIPVNANAIFPQPDGSILISSHDKSNSVNNYIYQIRGDSIIQSVLKQPGGQLASIAAAPFSNDMDNYVLHAPAYSNRVYAINQSGLASYFSLHFGSDTIPAQVIQSDNIGEQLILNPKKSYSYIVSTPLVQTKTHIILRASHKDKLITYILHKKLGTIKAYTGITDNIFLGGLSDFAETALGNECVYVLNPEPMQAYWQALNQSPEDLELFKKEKPALLSILEQMKENENPILIFATLKN